MVAESVVTSSESLVCAVLRSSCAKAGQIAAAQMIVARTLGVTFVILDWPALGSQPPCRCKRLFQFERHEDAVRIEHIIRKRRAFDKAVPAVKTAGGIEIFPRSRLQAEPRHAGRLCRRDDVAQHGAASALAAHRARGMHRFDFAVAL